MRHENIKKLSLNETIELGLTQRITQSALISVETHLERFLTIFYLIQINCSK